MSDPRVTLARDGLAAAEHEGLIRASRYATPRSARAAAPVAAIRRAPDDAAEQLDQLLFGEAFDVLETGAGWAFGQARRDGYVGFAREDDLAGLGAQPTHWIAAVASFAHGEPAVRAPAVGPVSLNALLAIEEEAGGFVRAAGLGWLPRTHVRAIGDHARDFVAVAERMVGVPYLWGGRSSAGLDCSGLILQALFACGLASPRDTDQQALMGEALEFRALRRGDLVFWRGHVGAMLDGERLIHANAHHMAVAIEPLATARARIAAADGGQTTALRRLPEFLLGRLG